MITTIIKLVYIVIKSDGKKLGLKNKIFIYLRFKHNTDHGFIFIGVYNKTSLSGPYFSEYRLRSPERT